MSDTTATGLNFIQLICPVCGHPEHAGLTCPNERGNITGFCGCWQPAKPAPTITYWPGAKQPFKCPVCNGSGRVHPWTVSKDTGGVVCNGCTGTGIVWGPP